MPRAEKMAVAVLDILGFKARLRTQGPESIYQQIMSPLGDLITNARIVGAVESGLPAEVRALSVSDTIVLFRSIEWEYEALAAHSQIPAEVCVRAVGAAAAEIVRRGLRHTPPVLFRGAIAFGECLVQTSSPPYCYLGAPIVEAYELEQAQDWLGVALGPSAANFVESTKDNLLFLRYPAPIKADCRDKVGEPFLVVNWLSSSLDAETLARSFGPPSTIEGVESKRRNTLAFFDYFRVLARPPPRVTYGGDDGD